MSTSALGSGGTSHYPRGMANEAIRERRGERQFGRTVLLLVTLGFAAVLAAGLFAATVLLRGQDQAQWVDHTHQVERQVMAIRLTLEEMRSARRGEVLRIAGDSGATYADASARFFRAIDSVGRLTVDNPLQQRNVARMRVLAKRLDSMFAASLLSGTALSTESERERQATASQVQMLANRMLAEEVRLLDIRTAAQRESIRIFFVVLAVCGGLVAFVGFGSVWVIRRYTQELKTSGDQLQLLNDNLELAVAERTTDLQRANDEIQRFAYIVSHDLRSPLVNVMGFTAELDASIKPLTALIEKVDEQLPELVTNEARLAVTEDLPESIGFIRTSTQKMDRLINAILRLSREGRRTITPERLDMGLVARGVVDNLQHRIDELGVAVRIASSMPVLTSDRLAIDQILSNLVENAIKYLKPGRPGEIDISGSIAHGRAVIAVKDNGRGIEPRDHERVFDLFRRSGMQDQPGEGIGLAHVRALAYRLGGTINVESELDKGAIFRVNLPVRFAGEKAKDEESDA
jgi:signal transduction histidine kinase